MDTPVVGTDVAPIVVGQVILRRCPCEASAVSVAKADMRTYSVGTRSAMPAYAGRLTPDEIADLVAYLLTLKEQ